VVEQLVLAADPEAAPLALEELGRLEARQQAVADHRRAELGGGLRQGVGGLHLLEVGVEGVLLQHAALEDDLQEVLDGGRDRHRRTSQSGPQPAPPGRPPTARRERRRS